MRALHRAYSAKHPSDYARLLESLEQRNAPTWPFAVPRERARWNFPRGSLGVDHLHTRVAVQGTVRVMSSLAVVVGAGPGLGAALARTFAAHHSAVAVLGRTLKTVEGVADDVRKSGGDVSVSGF